MQTLDISTVAHTLRISVKTARNRLAAGLPMPPSFVVGRQRLFLPDQLDAWLRSQPGAVLNDGERAARLSQVRRGRPRRDP
jgi:hypothetical protein